MSNDVVELERAADSLPDDWREVAVADVVAMLPGFAFKSEHFVADTDAGLPLIRIRDLGQTNTATRYVGDYDEVFAVRDGDILVGMDGAFEAVRWQGGKALLNQRVLKLSPARPDAIDEGYLFYRVQPALSELEQTISGTTVKHLSTKDLKRLVWKLPPLDDQRRIAEVLRSVDEAIAADEAALDGLRSVANAVIEERCFTAESYGRLPIGDFATFVGSGVTPKGGKDAYVKSGIAFIRSQNVHFDGLRDEGLAFIDVATDTKMARTRVLLDDVLLNITGASIGRCTIVPNDFGPANVNQHVCIIRPDPAIVLPAYLSLFLSSFDGQRQIDQLQGGLSREGLNFKRVRAITVPTPSLEDQAEIAELMGALRSAMRVLEMNLSAKVALRTGISSDLLSGRVRVPA